MCGIFGVATTEASALSIEDLKRLVGDLFKLSESRGKEAAGLAILSPDAIYVHKEPVCASRMIRSPRYHEAFDTALLRPYATSVRVPCSRARLGQPTTIIGHSRLVTNGGQELHQNNQPVVASGLIGIHNGIITNVDRLWSHFPTLQRRCEVDTEVLLSLVRHFLSQGHTPVDAVRQTFRLIEGAASVAVLFADFNCLLLATNNGSLYIAHSSKANLRLFASEHYILRALLAKRRWRWLNDCTIRHVKPGSGLLIDTRSLATQWFSLDPDAPAPNDGLQRVGPRVIWDRPVQVGQCRGAGTSQPVARRTPDSFHDHVRRCDQAIARLRRCTRCILPETMPFIEFDDAGVCNYCRHYRRLNLRGAEALQALVEQFRRRDGQPDCVVTFSGGRDSSYGLHYVKRVLGLNPVAYTYDWGMVTDLARRNQARLCGKLGVEHVLISADLAQKRRNIRLNVTAWLRKPDLGTIPLFMAGDKQYFYYANKLRQQIGCKLVVLCENMLETTGFKSGYCGIRPNFGAEHTYSLSLFNKLRLAAYYGRQYLRNPRYINGSVWDSLWAYCCYYFIPHEYLNIYNYIRWDEDLIERTLRSEYDWEVAEDTPTTWRIGDGTAAFYNYIYYIITGFSENDTFRSNQIREGVLTRQRALEIVRQENRPRFESIRWYCDTIGIDFESTIARINQIPTLYRR